MELLQPSCHFEGLGFKKSHSQYISWRKEPGLLMVLMSSEINNLNRSYLNISHVVRYLIEAIWVYYFLSPEHLIDFFFINSSCSCSQPKTYQFAADIWLQQHVFISVKCLGRNSHCMSHGFCTLFSINQEHVLSDFCQANSLSSYRTSSKYHLLRESFPNSLVSIAFQYILYIHPTSQCIL